MASTETIEQVKERIEELDPAEAQEELKQGDVALIDTREPNEYIEAHIDGAELVRPADVVERIEEVVPDHSQRVILYCASGNRSARAADELRELGYENAASVARRHQGLGGRRPSGRHGRGHDRRAARCATRATPCCPRSASRASSRC